MNETIDLSKIGVCNGTMRYGKTVEFWCESLDGGVTDARKMTVTFRNEAIAEMVADAAAYKG